MRLQDSLECIRNPKQLSEIVEVLEHYERDHASKLDREKVRNPAQTHRIIDSVYLEYTCYAKEMWYPLKDWTTGLEENQLQNRLDMEASFPRDLYMLPMPQILLSNKNDSVLLITCGRILLLWQRSTNAICRFGHLDNSRYVTYIAFSLRDVALSYPDDLFEMVRDGVHRTPGTVSELKPLQIYSVTNTECEPNHFEPRIFLPVGWIQDSRRAKEIESHFHAQHYRLDSIEVVIMDEEKENYLIRCENGSFYIWTGRPMIGSSVSEAWIIQIW